jgi:hypothetical protein
MTKNRKTKDRKKINVFLDLDNTVIYSITQDKFNENSYLKNFNYHIMDNDYIVFERPGLQPFLDWLFNNFNVSVWSAASPDYVDFIVRNVIEKNGRLIEYVLNSDNCEFSQDIFGNKHIKNLNLLWDIYDVENYGPYNTLIIDDLSLVSNINPNNSIKIKSFNTNRKDNINDDELKNIKNKLIQIHKNFEKNINSPHFNLT